MLVRDYFTVNDVNCPLTYECLDSSEPQTTFYSVCHGAFSNMEATTGEWTLDSSFSGEVATYGANEVATIIFQAVAGTVVRDTNSAVFTVSIEIIGNTCADSVVKEVNVITRQPIYLANASSG